MGYSGAFESLIVDHCEFRKGPQFKHDPLCFKKRGYVRVEALLNSQCEFRKVPQCEKSCGGEKNMHSLGPISEFFSKSFGQPLNRKPLALEL